MSVRRSRRAPPGVRLLPLLLLALLALPAGRAAPSADPPAGHGAAASPAANASRFAISGTVVDAYSGFPVANVTVRSIGSTLVWDNTTTNASGGFVVLQPAGVTYVDAVPKASYQGVTVVLDLTNRSVTGLELRIVPAALVAQLAQGTVDAPLLALLVVLPISGAVAWGSVTLRRRREAGLPGGLLSTFGRHVVRRLLLLPVQLLGVLLLLYVFGTYLPALAKAELSGCLVNSNGRCSACDPSALLCQGKVFAFGFYGFARAIFTGDWGLASIGFLRLPAVDFLAWWLPYSLELAAVALLLSIALGYPLGLAAGWRPDGPLDRGARGGSLTMLLLPSFLVVLFVLVLVYNGWTQLFGDSPYGLKPSSLWELSHGGFPSWIGVGGQTSPTGFPLVDAALHGDWAWFAVAGAKTLLQALTIAMIYVAIFFRYARSAVAEAARSPSIRAARARGVPEPTLRWRHTGRRILPIYLLTFGMTLPAYIGTQAVVEALFQDTPGFGTILFAEMTSVGQSGFGFTHLGAISYGNLYQVTIFLLALTLLVGNLCADVLARYLDPTLVEEARR
jgi:peptide/nickel transport system permease protein